MKKITIIILSIFIFSHAAILASAQDNLSNGAATGTEINGTVENGDIITSSPQGYKLSTSPYDPQIFGVVSLKPALYFQDTVQKNEIPVMSTGQVVVRVSSINGNITKGDYITSSKIPGVGEKATDNGFVLGIAEQSYSSNNPHKVGALLMTLQPHYAQITNDIIHTSFSSFSLGLTESLNSPLGVIRYFVAGGITLLSFLLGFRFFARASNRGVEAIGRNPLAKQAILISIFINSIITITIMFFGVAISYFILVL
jgi:hypothetical protein